METTFTQSELTQILVALNCQIIAFGGKEMNPKTNLLAEKVAALIGKEEKGMKANINQTECHNFPPPVA